MTLGSTLALMAALLLIAGVTVLIVGVVTMRAAQRDVKRRVDVVLGSSGAAMLGGDGEAAKGREAGIVRKILGVGVSRSWDSELATPVLLIAGLVGGTLLAVALSILFHAPVWVSAPIGAIAAFGPPQMLLRMEQSRVQRKFVDTFPDAIDMIVRMLRAGLPMTAAIRVVGTEAMSPVKEVFASVGDQMAVGIPFDRALISAGKRIQAEDFRFFTVAAALQQSTGGNLASTLETLSVIIRKRRAGRMKAKAVTAEARMSSYVLGSIPFLIVGALLVVNPKYLAPLVTDPRGNVILALALGSLSTGFFVMYSMMRGVTKV
jgi:tight adherence protein B